MSRFFCETWDSTARSLCESWQRHDREGYDFSRAASCQAMEPSLGETAWLKPCLMRRSTADSSVARKTRSVGMTTLKLAAPARAPAAPAAVTRTIARHDAAAEAASWSVAQVDDAGQRVRGVNLAVARRDHLFMTTGR